MIWSRGSSGAILMTWASAWLGSSAGMIPSSRHSVWNAASASVIGHADIFGAALFLPARRVPPMPG